MAEFKLTRLKKEDCGKLIEFLNNVFSAHNGKKMHFEKSLPHIFCENDNTMAYHIAAKDNGKICGCAGTYPLRYYVGADTLKVGVIENVAVDTKYRNRGIMQSIMNKMNDDNKAEGYDICFLLGDRKRYSHFGFDRCGVEYNFHITTSMLGKKYGENEYEYRVITKDDAELICEAHKLYSSANAYVVKAKEELYSSLTANNLTPYAVITRSGDFAGCFCTDESKSILSKIAIKDKNILTDILREHLRNNSLRVLYISVPEYSEYFDVLFNNCDRYQIYQPGCFKINNFQKVVECYMRQKNECGYLPDGKVTINSDLFGKWKIEKATDKITVEEFDGEAQITLLGMEVYSFLFGTASPKCDGVEKSLIPLIKTWFPLPLYLPSYS